MKLLRHGNPGAEKPGILIDDIMYDTSILGEDYTCDFIASGGLARLKALVERDGTRLPKVPPTERLGMPLANPGKIICVGLNYLDHARETGFLEEAEPILFLKPTSALHGPFDGITIPKGSQETDWETELGVVIGKAGTNLNTETAEDYIAGYVLHNDVSERAYMKKRGGTWDKGKGCNTFAPIGPYFVTKDEIADVNNLKVWLKLNGEVMQHGNTKDFIYHIPYLTAYASEFFGLQPCDIISTGTPSGTGIGQNPPRFLKPGDVIEYGIDGLGVARQVLKGYEG